MLLFVPMLAGHAAATDDFDTQKLTDALPDEAYDWLQDFSPRSLPDSSLLESVIGHITEGVAAILPQMCKTAGVLLTVCVLVSLGNALDLTGGAQQYILLAGVTAIGAAALTDFDSYLSEGLSSLQSLSDYSRVLLPTLASTAAMSGAVSSAAAKYAATALFMDILLSVSNSVIAPCISGYAALSLAEAAVGNEILKAARKLLKGVCTALLSAAALGCTVWLSVTGVISGAVDSTAAKAAKTAVSAALPIVGGILSDAAGLLTAAAGTLRVSVGVFGMLAVLCISAGPILTVGARYLVFKVTAAVCSCVADRRLSELVDNLGGCFGMILALNGTAALMLFLSLFSLIGSVPT